MGVSGWYNGITNDVKGLTSTLGIDVRDNWGFEIYYNAEITPWLHVSPDLQFLMNSSKGDDIAIVPGARLVLDL
jgi:carbohydrate-selective porin OprB